jgi:uncharacterized phage-associated protein
MSSVTFPFEAEKLLQALVFFSKNGVRDLTKLKAAKLLYFSDKFHLLRYGRPVIGDAYFCLDFGPVPSASLNIMNEALGTEEELPAKKPILERLSGMLRVAHDPSSPHPRFEAVSDVDRAVFSETEIEALEDTVRQYGSLPASRLVDLTHDDMTWRIPDRDRSAGRRADIPYRLFFEGQPEEVQAIWKLVEAEQEDRDLAQALTD